MAKEISYEFIRGDTQVLRKFRPTDQNKAPIVLTELSITAVFIFMFENAFIPIEATLFTITLSTDSHRMSFFQVVIWSWW